MELKDRLIKMRHLDVTENKIDTMIRDIRRYLVNRIEGFKINQQYLGIQALFRGYPIIVCFGTNFYITKYRESNKILIKLCMNYYKTYWKHQNQYMYNKNKQRERTIKWFDAEC